MQIYTIPLSTSISPVDQCQAVRKCFLVVVEKTRAPDPCKRSLLGEGEFRILLRLHLECESWSVISHHYLRNGHLGSCMGNGKRWVRERGGS